MDTIKLDFEQAKAKHLLFKSRLRSILYGVGADIDETPVLSHFECAVGKWIYSRALNEYGHIPEIHELEKVHANIHTAAREAVTLYKDGKVESARICLNNVESIADELVGLLSIVEKKVEENKDAHKYSGDYQSREVSMQELLDLVKVNQELDSIIKKQSGEVLRHKQILLESLMQLPANVSILRGPDHVIELMNEPAKAAIFNKDVIGKKVREAFPEIEGQGYFELLDKVFQTGEPFVGKELPVKIDRGNGIELLYANSSYHQLKDEHGNAEGIVSFSYEVTEQVVARKKVEEAARRATFITDAMPQMVWTADDQGNPTFYNKHWPAYTGKTLNTLLDKGWFTLIHAADMEAFMNTWHSSIESGNDFSFEHRLEMHSGEYRWHLTRATAELQDDTIVGWIGTSTDINDLKFLQDQLKQSYADLEVKVRFRNLELEKQNSELRKKLESAGIK